MQPRQIEMPTVIDHTLPLQTDHGVHIEHNAIWFVLLDFAISQPLCSYKILSYNTLASHHTDVSVTLNLLGCAKIYF